MLGVPLGVLGELCSAPFCLFCVVEASAEVFTIFVVRVVCGFVFVVFVESGFVAGG